MVFGSDVPVASIDPREGVFAAIERRDDGGAPARRLAPEERLSFEDAVRAYTVGGGSRRRPVRGAAGTLAPGSEADLVAWDGRSRRRAGLRGRPCVRAGRALTVVAGEVVMQR